MCVLSDTHTCTRPQTYARARTASAGSCPEERHAQRIMEQLSAHRDACHADSRKDGGYKEANVHVVFVFSFLEEI